MLEQFSWVCVGSASVDVLELGLEAFFLRVSVAGEELRYLQLVELCCSITLGVLQTEVAEDPEKVSTVHLQLGLPLVFILSQKETYEADRRTAEFVAWQLLGKAGVALLSRYFSQVFWGSPCFLWGLWAHLPKQQVTVSGLTVGWEAVKPGCVL